MKKQKRAEKPPINDCADETRTYPVHVLASSVPAVKMQAISDLAKACHELAKALSSVSVNATISHCTIHGAPGGAGIRIDG